MTVRLADLTPRMAYYFRTSSAWNCKEGKDSKERQRRACRQYGSMIGDRDNYASFYDQGVSGTTLPLGRRRFKECVEWCLENKVNQIVVESVDRFARDVVVSEMTAMQLRAMKLEDGTEFPLYIIPSTQPEMFIKEDAMNTLYRQMMMSFIEFERKQTVARLKAGRDAVKERNRKARKNLTLDGKTGKCGSKRSNKELYPKMFRYMCKLRRQPHYGYENLYWGAARLAKEIKKKGFKKDNGQSFWTTDIGRLLKATPELRKIHTLNEKHKKEFQAAREAAKKNVDISDANK